MLLHQNTGELLEMKICRIRLKFWFSPSFEPARTMQLKNFRYYHQVALFQVVKVFNSKLRLFSNGSFNPKIVFGFRKQFCSYLTSDILYSRILRGCSTGNGGAKNSNFIISTICDMQKMRKHRLFGNGISNFRSQMTTWGARGDYSIWWCKQQHGIQHLQESSL